MTLILVIRLIKTQAHTISKIFIMTKDNYTNIKKILRISTIVFFVITTIYFIVAIMRIANIGSENKPHEIIDSLKYTNSVYEHDVRKLKAQIDSLSLQNEISSRKIDSLENVVDVKTSSLRKAENAMRAKKLNFSKDVFEVEQELRQNIQEYEKNN